MEVLKKIKEYIYLDDADGLEESNLLGTINYNGRIRIITLAACIGSFKCLYSIIDNDEYILNYPIVTSNITERNVTVEDKQNNNFASEDTIGTGMTISVLTHLIYPKESELANFDLIKEDISEMGISNLLILKELDQKYDFIKLDKYYKVNVAHHFIEKGLGDARNAILKKEKSPVRIQGKTYQCRELKNALGIALDLVEELTDKYDKAVYSQRGYIRNDLLTVYLFIKYLCEKFKKDSGLDINTTIVGKDTHFNKRVCEYTVKEFVDEMKYLRENCSVGIKNIVNNIFDLFN